MANTISNIKMTNPIRGLVSKRRKRYTQDGFNLDLAYIAHNIIAMGFPAEKLEGVYRNPIDEVVRFVEMKHPDSYKIYNLCSERSYDHTKFKRVASYPFDDHNPPNIELIQSFCVDVHQWLNEDSKNVAAVHCKAGKGRTGTMICCYMLYSGQFNTAADALNHYGQQRTYDTKGVTIPSQRRYVDYYSQLLKSATPYKRVTLYICQIKLTPPPYFTSHQGTVHFSISDIFGHKLHCAAVPEFKRPHQDGYILTSLDFCLALSGDIKVEFSCKTMMRKEKLFHFWFNTYFVNETAEVDGDGFLIFTLNKCEIDDAHKDKQHKVYPQDFKIEVSLQKVPTGKYADAINQIMIHRQRMKSLDLLNDLNRQTQNQKNWMLVNTNHPNNQQLQQPPLHQQQQLHLQQNISLTTPPLDAHTPSESSEASSSESSTEEDGWESGEFTVPKKYELFYAKYDNYYYGSCISSSSCCSNNIINNQTYTQIELIRMYDQPNNTSNSNQLTNSSSKILITPSYPSSHSTTTSTTFSPYQSSPSGSATTITSRNLNKTKQFKAKSNNIKVVSTTNQFGSNSNVTGNKIKNSKNNKLRWLKNMRSDPDLKETLSKSVKIRPSNSIMIVNNNNNSDGVGSATEKFGRTNSNDNLLTDYYSTLCDKQLSFESPCKSPGDLMKLNFMRLKTNQSISEMPNTVDEDVTAIVVAKQIEEKSKIGFNVNVPIGKSVCDNKNEFKDNVHASSSNSNNTFNNNNNNNNLEVSTNNNNLPSSSSTSLENTQKSNNTILKSENSFCNRLRHHFASSKKFELSHSHDNVTDDRHNHTELPSSSNTDLSSCLSPVVPRANRCTPFSFREIRQELQSVIKSHNQQQQQNQLNQNKQN